MRNLKNITAVILTYLIVCLSGNIVYSQTIIPRPNKVQFQKKYFRFSKTISISSTDNSFDDLIPGFIESVERYASLQVKKKEKSQIVLIRNTNIKETEGYLLSVSPNKIRIEASSQKGCFYGLQSLIQLLTFSGESGKISCQIIEDSPRYSWRGFMLDESRHFFGTDEVKKILDQMAFLKLNKFHWHLTDAQGWRIEIKKYPLLTEIGAIGNHTDPKAPAGFYTQEEIKELVNYAAARYIDIIPEIDMPGHATAAVKAYPQFSGGGSERYPEFTFNPGETGTYTFLTQILREIADLFPYDYIHVGGDEVSFGNQKWTQLPGVRKIMNQENLTDLSQVEHYFLQRMSDSIQVIGKKVIGWDEVVSAGLNNNRTLVMWWRHDKPEVFQSALKNNFQVIMCPRIPLYFDFVQDENHTFGRKWDGKFAPVRSVYEFPSIQFAPESAFKNPLVKGIQANLWSETVKSTQRLEFMLFPRINALSEAAWTNDEQKDFDDFESRLIKMFDVYKNENIEYFDFTSETPANEWK